MTTTVIIPTYNGAGKILTVLRALERQNISPDEVIVVVDGSTDNTVSLLQSTYFQLKSFRIIRQENLGRGAVKNTGAEHASHELLLFLDDDMLPEADWLKKHLQHHEEHPETIVTGPAVDRAESGDSDFQFFKSYLSAKWRADLLPFNKKAFPEEKVFITAANFSIPRKLFRQIGGFNPKLRDVEDFDFAVRATALGIPVYYDDETWAWHMEQSSCKHSISRMRSYQQARYILLNKYPELYRHRIQINRTEFPEWKRMILSFFKTKWMVHSIDMGRFKWLPQSLRFKLYDITLTANTHIGSDPIN